MKQNPNRDLTHLTRTAAVLLHTGLWSRQMIRAGGQGGLPELQLAADPGLGEPK